MKDFQKIAVLGGGLLGGSLAMSRRHRGKVALWARRSEAVAEAKALGLSCATGDLEEALDQADLVILTVPVGAMTMVIDQALGAGLGSDALVTDVGSVKRVVHRTVGQQLAERGIPFIGGHPMAGSERRGVAAGTPTLFEGAACFLTDDHSIGEPLASALERFWSDLGCRVRWIEPAVHDELVARISHFPHVMAAAAAMVSLKEPEEARYGGGGLRDTTRVAGGDPGMWTEILMENRKAVAHSIEESVTALKEIQGALDAGDQEIVRIWLEKACAMQRMSRVSETSSCDTPS